MTTTSTDLFADLRFNVALGTVAYRTPNHGVRHDTAHVGRVAYREDTGAALALVGPAQAVVQPAVTVGVFEQLLERGAIRPEGLKARAWNGGARISIVAHTGVQGEIKTQRKVGEVIRHRLYLNDAFDGGMSLRIGSADEVLACLNGMVRLKHHARAALRHTASINERFQQVVIAMRYEIDQFPETIATAQRLADTRLNDRGFQAILDEWFPRNEQGERSARAQNQMMDVENLYYTGAGADPGSLWGAYQAATNWITHRRGRDATREEQSLFGAGAALNRTILNGLVERADRAAVLG